MTRQLRRLPLATLVVAASMAALPSPAAAQNRNDVPSEARGGSPRQAVASMARLGAAWEKRALLIQTQPDPQPKEPRDAVWNGLLIGAGVGALLGLIPDHYDDCEECHDSLYASIAVGAGVGVLIDWLRTGKSSPSKTSKPDALHMGVTVSPRALGLVGRIALR